MDTFHNYYDMRNALVPSMRPKEVDIETKRDSDMLEEHREETAVSNDMVMSNLTPQIFEGGESFEEIAAQYRVDQLEKIVQLEQAKKFVENGDVGRQPIGQKEKTGSRVKMMA